MVKAGSCRFQQIVHTFSIQFFDTKFPNIPYYQFFLSY